MKKMLTLVAALFAAATSALADLYVTPTGAGNKDGSSWANAYAGIQAAVDHVDAAVAADANYPIPTIHVADGTYSRVSITNDIALDVRSVNGAAATVIDGGGTNNCVDVRLSGYTNFGQSPKFTGFTLRNGNVRSLVYDRGGGAAGGSLFDCIIEDCVAWMGGGTYSANTMRCIIRRCDSPTYYGGAVYGGVHKNDLIVNNNGKYALIYNAYLYSCTVADNTAGYEHYGLIEEGFTYNCIFWGNLTEGVPHAHDDASDPKFVGGGDYRLRAGSPALDDGNPGWQTQDYVGLTDLAGNDRVQGVRIDRGCYEATNGQGVEGVLVLASAEGNGTVSPAHSFVGVDMTVTITADTSTWHRDVTAWKTNGVVVAGATGNSLTFIATGEQIDVVAQFATLDWFVNGTTGSDTANNGRTASTAFKTIQHAIDCAAPEETIFVAAGTYAPIDASRVNVSIIGAGRDTTIIDGGGTTRCADLGERNFSYLQGFTLRNGRHMNVGTTPGQGEAGTGGGGAKGGYLIDCAIENCHSTFGGGAFHSEIHRSIIRDCSAYEGGGAIFGEYFNCLFDRNWAVQGGAASSASLWGCTVVRSRAVDFAAVYVSTAYSTIFWGNQSGNERSNYWLQGHGECCFEEEMEDYNVSFTGDPLFVDPENGDFRLREDSPCIDCGWGDVLEDEFDVRGAGYPRLIDELGGEEIADMGCYEGGVPLSQIPQHPTPPTPRTIQVSGGGAALQNAINSASDGDTLVVANGTYSAIDARGKVLTIVSENGPAAAIIRGSSTTRAATLSTSMTHLASTLAGFTVEGGTSTDLLYGGGGILGGYVSNCVVRGNAAYCGGGVAMAYVTHSIISNNTATVSGGGACASWLDTCLVVHNAANVNLAGFDLSAYGGGVPSANDNESGGGGIAFSAANFCTITRNTSTTYAGGGMFVVLDNTYIAGNTASGGPAGRQNADLFPQYPNHVCATSPNFIDDEGFVNAGNEDSLADPDHGDYRLKATSLCVEGGDMAFASHRYATDLDGNPRWRGSAPDIGCYEAAAAAPVVVPDVDASTGPVWEDEDEGVLVEWGVSRGAEWYTVHRSTTDDFATASQVGRVDAPGTEFLDATAAISVRYYYWVVAHSTVGDGPVGASVEGYWVPELVITTPYLPNGLTRELYSTNLAVQGGMPPYTWTVETPAWLSVSGSTISGMPRMAGPTTVRVTVEDADGQVDIRSWTLTIENNPAPFGPATPYAGAAYPGNYLIRNFDELRLFEETLRDPAGFDFEGATFTLVNDIDCGGRAFAPTNGACSYFKGTFDGQGHVISNYVNNGYSTGSLLGDAGYGAVVKDVTLVGDIRLTTLWDRWGTTALSENSGAAAFAEYVQAGPAADAPPGLTMLNCHFVGTVTNAQSGDSGFAAAGLVAYVSKQGGFDASPVGTVNLRMSNCTVRASVDGREGAGGLVAAGFGIEATDCSVTGGVYRATNIGGLGGFIRRSSFTDCTFDGEVDAIPAKNPAEGGGGLVGAARGVTLRRCAARARVCWEYPTLHDDDHTFTACGGAIGVSWDDTACYDCSFEGSIQSRRGFFGGFIGWADSAEVFSNCHVRATYAPDGLSSRDATGGFAGVVSSDGARFVDCSVESLGGGKMIDSGFFSSQQLVTRNESGIPYTVGSNSFLRCSVKNMNTYSAGFAKTCWNATFRDCTVRDCMVGVDSPGAGFVLYAGQDPNQGSGFAQTSAQTSVFEDCSVAGTRVSGAGFVLYANTDSSYGSALCTNVFRRCRAGCLLGNSSGSYARGFAYGLFKGTLVEDCAAYGVTMLAGATYGFAEKISIGATVRRCVGAVLPRATEDIGAGFADSISYTAPVEDCYSVYAPPAIPQYGYQGGFVLSASVGYNSTGPAITRCFALAAPPDASDQTGRAGSFCGSVNNTSYANFIDCYRPAESAVRDIGNIGDDAGVSALAKAQFANATVATMPNYDFQNVWRSPQGVASSPYLAASTDGGSNFWFAAAVVSGEGSILVNGEAPRESYPIGAALTVRAVPTHPDCPFTGWVGEGFADPLAQETTYTVRNVSAIGATFGTPIYTVEDFFAIPNNASDAYVLMNDLDFTEHLSTNHYFQSVDNFQGKFFGQGHTIRYACTNSVSTEGAAAPFSSLTTGAQLRDLTVESVVSNCYGKAAGLVASIGNGVLVSNCHARLVGTAKPYPNSYDQEASCQYFGFVRTVSGTDIRIVDCTAEIKALANCSAAGFADTVSMTGGEIARCAAFAEIVATNDYCNSRFVSVSGGASGFAHYLSLSGGATVRECLAAGVADGRGKTSGFAYQINLGDAESSIRDCYSTMEVVSRGTDVAGFAYNINDNTYNEEAGVSNLWFGGSVRAHADYTAYGFGRLSYVNPVNCYRVRNDDSSSTAGVTDIAPAAARQTGSWTGYDFSDVWSMTDGATTPYFAWSLADGTSFRLFAVQEPGTTITHPATALPGSNAAVSADPGETGAFFCSWAGAGAYANAGETPTTLLADNHRTVRAVWGKAIRTRAELEAIADDPAGTYALGCDIDLGGEPWTPLCQDEYTPFTGTIYGNGHTISNMTVETETARAGLFGGLGAGATITDLNLANPVVRGANCVGTLAGYVDGATIGGCTVSGADVAATGERAGCFVGQIVGDTSVSRCSVVGDIAGSDRYVGGFVGSAEGSAAIEKCYALGSVTGTGGEGFGGFVGYAAGDSVSISECFACGAVAASGRNSVGGFAGYVYDSPSVSDCYALADVAGGSYVGGFAGQLYYCSTAFARCYAAGSTVGSSDVGGFAGRQYRGSPTFADCFRISDGLADVGAADLVGIDALSAAAMHSRSSFAAFHATGKWAQTDGLTQPYFAWSLVDGKFLLSGDAATVNGLGAYAPGAQAPISANAQGRFFIGWTGGATYADASASSTTVLLDNFRVVDYLAGASISTRAELAAIANDPAGTYGLAADIDLGGAAWTPIASFTGKLYGRGHTISNLTVTGSSNYAGLFAYVSGEVSGLTLLNPVVSGGNHTGAFAGCVNAGATVNRCAVIGGRVTASGNYSGVFAGSIEGAASVGECFAVGTIASTASYVGGFSGYVGQNNTAVSDCYAVSDATGSQRVGSFTGHAETSSCSIRRCYAAGTASGSSDAGGFAGYVSSSPVIADCFAQTPSAAMTGVTVLDAAGMRAASNFAAFRAAGCWSQIDGKTQPYFAWGLVDGGFLLSGDAATITGLGACAPGAQAPISVDPTGGIFLGWTGGATYADASSASTTVLADNYRTVSASLGSLITTRAELEAISSNPAGYYGLGADIDLSGAPWTPLGSSSQPFTGTLYGRGYKITGLAFDNTSSGDSNGSRAGLFRYVRNATIDGIHLEGVSINGYERCGALAGEVQGATTIRNCSAQGSVSGNYNYIGLLAGCITGSGVLFEGCATTGSVSAVNSDAGGFAGIVYGGAATFIDCHASAAVSSAGSGTSRGGFLSALYSGSGASSFTRCTVEGSVSASGNSYVGGFISYVGRPGTFTDCSANVRVSGGQHTGGFAGRICDGANGSTFLRCTAGGDVSATSDSAGGFVGTSEKNATFTECRALGAVSSTSEKAGGFVGNVTTANAFQRCMAAGSVTATKNAGGFVGYNSGSGTTATECFAIGDVTATTTDSDANAGGFLGYGYYGAACTDCYAIGSAKGLRAVGGFAGQVYDAGNVFTRCYAAGALDCTGTYAGAFVGYPRRYGAVTDCRVQFAGVRAAGTSAAGDSAAFDGVTELDSAGMHARSNFAPYHALDPQVWAQIDGATHPYFTWSLSDGRMSLLGATVGASGGAVAGAGWHEPGATVTIRAVESDTAVFVGWTGTTPYANPGAATTTVVLDNFRTVTARFSKLVSTAGQLADLRNDLASDVALGADIDLSALDGGWTPIGDNSAPFTGTFHGKGHTITGLSYENTASAGSYAGLFGAVKDATIEDVHLEGVDLAGYQYTGALVGDVQGRTTIRDCSAEGSVTGANTYTGLLVGRVSGAGTAFENCAATGAVVSAFAETGGLVGGVTATASFADCAASVDVSGTGGNNKGGFVGSVNAADTLFTNCVAVGSANGAGTVGGFVGSSSGSSVQYVDCEAHGPVSGTGDNTGGFAGSSSSGPRFVGCGAFGAVSSSSKYVGGFIGNGSNSAFWRCLAVGSATGSQYVGGFLGYNYSGNLTVAECFALGDVTATTTGSDAFAGGFVGSVSASTSFTDSYCLGTVKGLRKVGGFAGTLNNTGLAFTRCYAAGGLDCSGTYAGAFAGYLQSAATFGDCAVLCAGDLHAVGSSTAGTSDQNASIAEYDAAGMKDSDNFQTWLAIDDADGSVWSQADNLSQPYLAWSAPDGKLVVYPSIGGSGRGEIAGAWTGHNPGSLAQVTAVPQDSFFVDWIGSTPYTDRTAATTTIALDNHRVAAARLGRLIYTADELDAVRNNLGGIYGLGADIDLAGRDWTPIGSESSRFTGQFYGYGHAIENMLATNNPSVNGRGLFGGANGATFDGITVSGTVVGTGYYVGGLVGTASATLINGCTSVVSVTTSRYGGGLIGRVEDGTVIRGCSAAGTVKSTGNYGYSGGFAGSGDGSFEIRDSVSSAEVTAVASYVGGFIGYVTGSGASVISGCRADGYAGGNGEVGGFVGYVSAPLTISDCVARGDVRSSGSNYGGFVGRLNHASATIANCWCSGAVWGTGGTIGAFIGNKRSGILQNCQIYAYGAGPRPFCGDPTSQTGGSLTASQIDALSADWPAVKQHVDGATPISTAEELFAVTNNLAGIYVLKNDIDLGGATISPIGNYTTAFSGEFYGKNHKIKNFVVNNADRYAGLFGKIAGGRVSGVVAEGTVVGAPTVSGYSDVGVGGFAGKIQSRSLVDGCSFQGAVTNKTTYNAGGFVGMTDEDPVILRNCVLDATVANPSGQSDTGGFIGYHRGGYIMDCYAIADVSGRNYLGGFTGDGGNGKITTSYCSSTVTTTGSNYIGAFSGSAGSGNVTKSYYDSGKTSLLAVNNAAYTGITPLTSSEMLHAEEFPDLDFVATWAIKEGETTPYLLTFIVQKTGYDAWLEQWNLPEGSDPLEVVNGVPLAARYLFGIVPMNRVTDIDGKGMLGIEFNASGAPCLTFPSFKVANDVNAVLTVVATPDLDDWVVAPGKTWPREYEVDLTQGLCLPDLGTPPPPKMFFRWRLRIAEE